MPLHEAQRNDFRPRQLRCSFAARLSASRSGEVHSDEELIQDTTTSKRRTVQDEGHTTPDWQCLLGVQHRQHARAPMPTHGCLALVSCDVLLHVGSRANDALSVSQILADNFENVMLTYASIFTGPQAQIPSSPYQQGLGLVRG